MCIIHDESSHHIYQDIMTAFERSRIVSPLFLQRVGYLLCTCFTDVYFDSKSIIAIQRSLYEWFDTSINATNKDLQEIERLASFKHIVDDLKSSGQVDSGTKIVFMRLLKDLDSLNFSQLRQVFTINTKKENKPVFYSKLVRIKFDLKLCSAKEFCELITKIDNCALKYIELTNRCSIFVRDPSTLTIRHFMGEIDATIEARNEKLLFNAEQSLKRLADAVHYRLAKQIPSCDSAASSLSGLKVLLQSPPRSCGSVSYETWRNTNIDSSSLSQY